MLGLIYKISFDSIFLGSLYQFSHGSFQQLYLKMLDIIMLIKFKNTSIGNLLIWPSTLFFTSVILREPFQLLFFNLAVFFFENYFTK